MPPAKQRTPELRDHVLAAALELLAGEGVGGFTARGVATAAGTSTPAVYELFGDKGGLLREVFFAGFRLLADQLAGVAVTADPRADLVALLDRYRRFMGEHAVLAEVMFSRPFTDFQPGEAELDASSSVRILVVARVRRCTRAGVLDGDDTDIAHVLVALVQGLAAAERARRLGAGAASIDRRWSLALEAVLHGFGPQRA